MVEYDSAASLLTAVARALYGVLLSPELAANKQTPMFLSLLFKAVRARTRRPARRRVRQAPAAGRAARAAQPLRAAASCWCPSCCRRAQPACFIPHFCTSAANKQGFVSQTCFTSLHGSLSQFPTFFGSTGSNCQVQHRLCKTVDMALTTVRISSPRLPIRPGRGGPKYSLREMEHQDIPIPHGMAA